MEPLAALAIAIATVQFLDFAGSLVSGTWQIYRSSAGEADRNTLGDVRAINNDLLRLNRELKEAINDRKPRDLSPCDKNIVQLGQRCTELGEQLASALDRLKSQGKHQLWASFRLALKSVWSQSEVESLQRTLQNYREQISLNILVSLRHSMHDILYKESVISQGKFNKDHGTIETTLQETQQMCREVLREISKSTTWQSEVLEAIDCSYTSQGQNSRGPSDAAAPVHMHSILRSKDAERIDQQLLHFLRFREIDFRYERILPAHRETFEWIFRPPTPGPAKWTDFSAWLGNSEPLYWMTGKPGAGKSTLMRFIHDDKRTQRGLKGWAAERPAVMAYFFFWNSGTEIQMSYEGLLRTLIFQILEKLPHLIPAVFSSRIEAAILFGQDVSEHNPWSWEELTKAFRTLLEVATRTHKIMFFIDGMDEFEGSSADLIHFITDIIDFAPDIKVCASSRPWPVFEDAFGHRPQLRMEDLTYEDIYHYVHSKFMANKGFKTYQQLDPSFASQLIQNVCVKSSGVFLWVYLVTQSLLDGVSGGERLSDLQSRLEALPADLENLFSKILDDLDDCHYERASRLFQIVEASLVPLTLLHLSDADEDDPEYAIKTPQGERTYEQANSRAELMRRRVNTCCKGLLEARAVENQPLFSAEVGYLHRTVKDFLNREEIWSTLCDATKEDFNKNLRLFNSHLMRLRTQDRPMSQRRKRFRGDITYSMEYAVRADPQCKTIQITLLNAIDSAATKLVTSGPARGSMFPGLQGAASRSWASEMGRSATTFLGLMVQCQLVDYVDATLRDMPHCEAAEHATKDLHNAVLRPTVSGPIVEGAEGRLTISRNKTDKRLILLLFQHGANPNYRPMDSSGLYTTWEWLLVKGSEQFSFEDYLEVVAAFLDHGADPRSRVISGSGRNDEGNLHGCVLGLVKQKQRETKWSHYWSRYASKLHPTQ